MTLTFEKVIEDVVRRAYILPAETAREESDRRDLAESMLSLSLDCLEIGMSDDELDSFFESASRTSLEDQGIDPDSLTAETMTAVDQRMRPLCIDAVRSLARIP